MGKLTFWLMVVFVSMAGIYITKMIASQTNVPAFKNFVEAI